MNDSDFTDGMRVFLREDVEHFPLGIWKAGEVGTLVSKGDPAERATSYWVKLDRHYDELDAWHNELEIMDLTNCDGLPPWLQLDPVPDDLVAAYLDGRWIVVSDAKRVSFDNALAVFERLEKAQEWIGHLRGSAK